MQPKVHTSTTFQREYPIIYLSQLNFEKHQWPVPCRVKLNTGKKGKAFKEVNVEDVNLHLHSNQFKAMQGMKHFLSLFSVLK